MEKKVARVVYGFTNLSTSQQRECLERISRYLDGSYPSRIELSREAYNDAMRVDMGPLTGGCPCCGK